MAHWNGDQVMCFPVRRQAYLVYETAYYRYLPPVSLQLSSSLSELPGMCCHYTALPITSQLSSLPRDDCQTYLPLGL